MGFEVKTVLSLKELNAYQKMAGRSILKKKTLMTRGLLLVVGVAGLTLSAVAAGAAGVNGMVALGTILSALCLAMGFTWYSYLTWRIARKTPADFEQHFYFNEENVVASAAGRQILHNYRDFATLAESGEYFLLFLDGRSGYILPKDGFLKGESGQFGEFIAQKTGKNIIPVKL